MPAMLSLLLLIVGDFGCRIFECDCDVGKHAVGRRADRIQQGNERDRDERRDEGVFDYGRPGFIP